MTQRWYIIHVYSGFEKKVVQHIREEAEKKGLTDQIGEILVPSEEVVELRRNQKVNVERKFFPGYVLIKMIVTDDSWYVVRNTRGCTGFVGPASEPTPLSDEEVEHLFGIELPSVEVNFKVGDRVQISGTDMDGFVGVVQDINLDMNTVDVLVSMFGRETPTTIPLNQVIKVED